VAKDRARGSTDSTSKLLGKSAGPVEAWRVGWSSASQAASVRRCGRAGMVRAPRAGQRVSGPIKRTGASAGTQNTTAGHWPGQHELRSSPATWRMPRRRDRARHDGW